MQNLSARQALRAASIKHMAGRALDRLMPATLFGATVVYGSMALSGSGFGLLAAMSLPGTLMSAAYMTLPRFRAWAVGEKGPTCPPQVFEAAGRCMVRARLDGDLGIWMVKEHGSDKVTFMTPRDFEAFRSSLPAGTTMAVVDQSDDRFHVRRYAGGRLRSGEDAAYRVFDLEGNVVRAVDYEDGTYVGERDLGGPAPPAP